MPGQVVSTVVAAALSGDLIALSDLKADLGLTSTTDDTYLGRLISMASAAAAAYCNRTFVVETVMDRFVAAPAYQPFLFGPSTSAEVLQLSRAPVLPPEPDSNGVPHPVTVTLASPDGSSVSLVTGTDFLIDAPAGQLIRIDSAGWQRPWPQSGLTVTYSAGFSTIPFDIQDAVTRLAKARYASRTRDPLLRSENIPGVAANTYWVATGTGGNLPPDVADALDQYRVPVIA